MSDQIIGLINPGMSLIFAAGGFALWLRDRSLTYVLGYVLAAILIGFSFALNHYSQNPGARGVQMLISGLSIIAVIALVWSMCRRLGQSTPLTLWGAGGIATLVLVYFTDHARDVSASLLAVNCYCGVVMVMGTQIMALTRSKLLVDRLLVWIFAIVAVQFFVRPIAIVMLNGAMTTAEYRSSAGHAVLVVTAAMFTLALTAAILAATISDQIRAVKQAMRKDELSGLLQRSAFEEESRAFIANAQAEERTISMVIADIDHFKRVNDRWGHPAGDAAIAAVGEIIAGTIRPGDLAGRIGGEEFCIFVKDCPAQAAGRLAERLRAALVAKEPVGIGKAGVLTASFGVAELRRHDSYADIYARADAALYLAKEQGRNRVVVDTANARTGALLSVQNEPTSELPTPLALLVEHRGESRGQTAGLRRAAAIANGA